MSNQIVTKDNSISAPAKVGIGIGSVLILALIVFMMYKPVNTKKKAK